MWSSYSTSGIYREVYPDEMNSGSQRGSCTPRVHCSIIPYNQDMETTYTSTGGWMDEESVAPLLQWDVSQSLKKKKKEEILPFATTLIDLEELC